MEDLNERIASSFRAQSLMRTLGAQLVHVEQGVVHIALPLSDGILQQHGFVHAGAITSVVDSACGYAALSTAPPGSEVVSVEFKINFPRPAVGRRFLAVGRVQSAGKQLVVCTGEVHAYADEATAPKVVALMQATMFIVPAAGRG